MHYDLAISDSRMARDSFSIASRQPIPFGGSYRSTIAPLGSTATSTKEWWLFPSGLIGQPITYGEVITTAASVFTSGLSHILTPHHGSNPVSQNTTAVSGIRCNATLGPLTGPRYCIVSALGSDARANCGNGLPLPADVVALDTVGNCGKNPQPWITQGLGGYHILEFSDRALVAGEVRLPGIAAAIVTLELNPTYPEVLLFLWLSTVGSVEGLDLASVKAMGDSCRTKGLFYNGDVFPDRFEAWVYQAAFSHGLRVNRSRLGISLAPLGTLGNPIRLLTTVNSRDLTRRWEPRVAVERLRYGVRGGVVLGAAVVMPTHSEELLGVREGDTTHVSKITALWAQEQAMDTFYSMQVFRDAVGLRLGDVVAIADSTSVDDWSGFVTGQSTIGVMTSWNATIISGTSDTLTSATLTDASKNFVRASAGDTLELSIAGTLATGTVSVVTGSTITFTPALTEVPASVSYRVLQSKGPVIVHWQTQGQAVENATVTPKYDPISRSIVYPLASTLPKGTPIAVGSVELVRIHSIDGVVVEAIG